MEDFLSFVTIDKWELIFTWCNLLILYLIMKKILWKPVSNMIKKREQEVEDMYKNAQNATDKAEGMKAEYEHRLASSKAESEEMVKNAVRKAQLAEEGIIRDAHEKANRIVKRAEEEIELEKQSAVNDVKNEISDMAITLASKVIEKDINEEDHAKMIDDFINNIGDAS